MDEISQVYKIYEQKLEFLERLRKNRELLEQQPQAAMTRIHKGLGNNSQTMTEQMDWAVDRLGSNHEGFSRALNDLRNSLG